MMIVGAGVIDQWALSYVQARGGRGVGLARLAAIDVLGSFALGCCGVVFVKRALRLAVRIHSNASEYQLRIYPSSK